MKIFVATLTKDNEHQVIEYQHIRYTVADTVQRMNRDKHGKILKYPESQGLEAEHLKKINTPKLQWGTAYTTKGRRDSITLSKLKHQMLRRWKKESKHFHTSTIRPKDQALYTLQEILAIRPFGSSIAAPPIGIASISYAQGSKLWRGARVDLLLGDICPVGIQIRIACFWDRGEARSVL